MRLLDILFRGNAARDAKLDCILAHLGGLMAKVDQLAAVIADINDATNRVASKVDAELATIEALQAKLASGTGVDPAELDPVLANLVGVRNRLQGLGADPTNPVPVSADLPAAGKNDAGSGTATTASSKPAPEPPTTGSAPAGDHGAID